LKLKSNELDAEYEFLLKRIETHENIILTSKDKNKSGMPSAKASISSPISSSAPRLLSLPPRYGEIQRLLAQELDLRRSIRFTAAEIEKMNKEVIDSRAAFSQKELLVRTLRERYTARTNEVKEIQAKFKQEKQVAIKSNMALEQQAKNLETELVQLREKERQQELAAQNLARQQVVEAQQRRAKAAAEQRKEKLTDAIIDAVLNAR
jgi:hypothetical protein